MARSLKLFSILGLITTVIASLRGIGLEARCWHLDHSCAINPTDATPGVPDCTQHWFDGQHLDHFNFRSNATFSQRYFVHDTWWTKGGPIWFYCGNEANVELYVNSTGLMWENAKDAGAMLVFAEHRYYGETLPFQKDPFNPDHLQWLTMVTVSRMVISKAFACTIGTGTRRLCAPDTYTEA